MATLVLLSTLVVLVLKAVWGVLQKTAEAAVPPRAATELLLTPRDRVEMKNISTCTVLLFGGKTVSFYSSVSSQIFNEQLHITTKKHHFPLIITQYCYQNPIFFPLIS